MENWQIRIAPQESTFGYNLYVFRRHPSGAIEVLQHDGQIEEKHQGESMTPTLRLEDYLMKPLIDALDKTGVRSDRDAMIEGTLKAQSYHLEDLRSLLNLKKES